MVEIRLDRPAAGADTAERLLVVPVDPRGPPKHPPGIEPAEPRFDDPAGDDMPVDAAPGSLDEQLLDISQFKRRGVNHNFSVPPFGTCR